MTTDPERKPSQNDNPNLTDTEVTDRAQDRAGGRNDSRAETLPDYRSENYRPESKDDLPRLETPEEIEDFALKEDYALNPQFIKLVIEAVEADDGLRLRELLDALHPADIADLLGFLSEDIREAVIPWIPADLLPEVLAELDDEFRDELIDTLPVKDLAEVMRELDSDDATAVFEDLEEDQQKALLEAMPESEREAFVTSLRFEEETAGRVMQREVMAAPSFWEVGQCIDHMRENADSLPEAFFDIYVIDPSHKVLGGVPVATLLRSKRDVALLKLMEPVTEIPASMDQEEVAYIFEKYHLISAPVVDEGNRLIGQITVDDVVNIIQEESQEDMLALAGVSDQSRDASAWGITRSRFWWLLINLGTAILASTVISNFEEAIQKLVALAVLNPIVASMGGNAATQTLAVAVRALATRELNQTNMMRTILREVGAAVMNGLAFAIVIGLVTIVWFHYLPVWITMGMSPLPLAQAVGLGGVIGLAMVTNLFFAAVAGIVIPLILDRLGYDPASSATVFVTTVTDCVGFFAFLGLASVFLL